MVESQVLPHNNKHFEDKMKIKQVKNSREGRCVTRMFRGPILVDRMMGGQLLGTGHVQI